jgi:molybdopterin/thiamine biosynthesis adenylyltransferase
MYYADCVEVLPDQTTKIQDGSVRDLTRFLGSEVARKLEEASVFMIGCGAIGCELLKNFAMLNLGIKG